MFRAFVNFKIENTEEAAKQAVFKFKEEKMSERVILRQEEDNDARKIDLSAYQQGDRVEPGTYTGEQIDGQDPNGETVVIKTGWGGQIEFIRDPDV